MIFNFIGFYSLLFSLIFSLVILYYSYIEVKNHQSQLNPKTFIFSFLHLLFVVISFLSLVISFINSDFSNETVFNNSHTTKPLFYKISGTWGNHEGSLLLWLLVLSLFIYFFLIYSKKEPKKYRVQTLVFQHFIIIGFTLFIILTSNPFTYLFPIPNEGLGLNPILQDPALAIHPPILYLGYVGCSIIFSSSLSALVNNYVNKNWAIHIKRWALISWIFLTIGILLGSIWAYYELGWGGFWFWDPVENVSLMPWICLTALIHSLLILEKKNLFTSWILILSFSTFLLSVSGTFLVRSGILNSVHTFANDPERGLFILCFLFILTIFCLVIFLKYKNQNSINNTLAFLSKETSVLINNWFMMYFLAVVFIGTTYPIFLEVISNEKISVGPPFYIKLIVPFFLPFLVLMALGPNTFFLKMNLKKYNLKLLIYFILSVIISILLANLITTKDLFLTLILVGSIFLFISSFRDFFVKKDKYYSQRISHFAFSLLILSIILNIAFSTEVITNLKVGEKFKFNDNLIDFQSISVTQEKNYKSLNAKFRIQDNNEIVYLEPSLRIYNQPKTITSEADIKTNIYSDKFLVFNLINDEEIYNIKYQNKPFMIWIWISAVLLSLGGFVNFLEKRKI